MERTDLSFRSGGESCAAWLVRPAAGAGAGADEGQGLPCVVLAHGFGGVREARLDAFAERFSEAGMAALVFEYRHFGASDGDPRQLVDIGRQHEDWRAAVSFARALEGVDPERVALWGTSFSGGHVIEVAAADRRVAAVVSQAPFVDGLASLRLIPTRTLARLTVTGIRDELGRLGGRAPTLIPIVGPPRSVAAMTTADAEPGYLAMIPPGARWRNEVVARVALRVGTYRPIRAARRVRSPLLMCVCDRDAITPPEPARRAAALAPRGELRRYPVGHFDIYFGEAFEQAVADQIEFLRRHLLRAREAMTAEAAS